VTDVHEARARHALALAQEVAARSEVTGRQAELERLTGEPAPLPPMRVAGTLPPVLASELEGWLANAQHNNLQVRIQRSQVEVAKRESAKSQAQHLPTLDLVLSRSANFASGSLNSPADLASRVHAQQVGIQLNVPLFSGGAAQSRVRESLALEDKAREELLSAQRSAQVQVRQSFSGVVNGLAQVQALEAAAEAGRQAVQSNQIGFRIGTRINPDVLNAQQQLYTTLRDLTRARIDTMMHGLRLKAAAGSLAPDALQALDGLLETEQAVVTSDPTDSTVGASSVPALVIR